MPTLFNDPTKLIEGDISKQTHQVMQNLKIVLAESKYSLDDVDYFYEPYPYECLLELKNYCKENPDYAKSKLMN